MKKAICLSCPVGCELKITEEPFSVEGNKCPRGIAFAKKEIMDPERILTTTVTLNNNHLRRLPVRSERAIPLSSMKRVMDQIERIEVTAPVTVGDIIKENLCHLGVNLVATRSVE